MAPRSCTILLTIASTASLVCAQQAPTTTGPVKTLFVPNIGDKAGTLYGSIIAAAPQATTYQINCPSPGAGSDHLPCGVAGGMKVVDGESRMEVHMSYTAAPTDDLGTMRAL